MRNMNKKMQNETPVNMERLLNNLKEEDQKYTRIFKGFQIVYIVLLVIYLTLFVFNPDDEITKLDRISGVFNATSMLIFALYFNFYYKNYRKIDYAIPTLELMKNVVKRYRIWRLDLIWVFLAILCIDVGVSLTFYQRTDAEDPMQGIIYFNLIFLVLLIISISLGYAIWYTRHKPIRDAAKKIIADMEA